MRRPHIHPRPIRSIVTGFRCFLFACLLAAAIHGRADDLSTVKFGLPDSWVKPQFFSQLSANSPLLPGADDYLLLREEQIDAVQNKTFFHTDRQILTIDGVQNDSTLTIDFNTNYQSVTLHWVRIWRGGQYLDHLDTNRVEVVQREKDLDQFMLTGKKSVVLVLDDVRVGDIIDYAYSIQGPNPVLGGHFSAIVPVRMEKPAGRLLTRVLWPRQKTLYAQPHGCSVQAATVAAKDTIEYDWDFRQAPGIDFEDSVPAWFDPEQWIQLSDFSTWTQINQWALDLYQTSSPFSPDLSAKIAEWRQIAGQEQQILAVLRFVQDDVRYFGIELGAGTVKPADPSTVFSRRRGDCKDKSFLFVTVLRALGIQAYPVLVNSTMGRAIAGWAPSPDTFDHCIAAVQCNGQTFWLDPTITYQRGPLAAHYLPDYGYGLVIAPGTRALTPIPQTTGLSQTTTTEYFLVRGVSEPTDLKVVTIAQGRDADVLRQLFATTKPDDISQDYTHFYSNLYPGIKMSSPVAFEDNEQQNQFQTTETYSIDNIWSHSKGTYQCEFYPSLVDPLLAKPVHKDRNQPLAISFPEHLVLRTEATLPYDWPYGASDKTISDSAFSFRKFARCDGNKLVMQYEYQSLADSVSSDQVGDHLQRLDQCSQLLGDNVIWRSASQKTPVYQYQ
jgi:transglutaminase-like putative cysteine protease